MNERQLSVVVGRFQVPDLHVGHRYLLDRAASAGDLLVVLGSTAGLPDARNPLPYEVRRMMLAGAYPACSVVELFDTPSDAVWSAGLDALIERSAEGRAVVLYASRDSFASVYTGRYPVVVLPPLSLFNGTALRGTVEHVDSREYRAGLIMAQRARLPISYQTVDVGVIRYERSELLLGHKPGDGAKLRLVGGFVDPAKDASLEAAAGRELREEVGDLSTHGLQYLGSYRVRDHRYAGGSDGVMTALFASYLLSGMPRAQDDIDAVEWVPFSDVSGVIVPDHAPLAERLVSYAQEHQ